MLIENASTFGKAHADPDVAGFREAVGTNAVNANTRWASRQTKYVP